MALSPHSRAPFRLSQPFRTFRKSSERVRLKFPETGPDLCEVLRTFRGSTGNFQVSLGSGNFWSLRIGNGVGKQGYSNHPLSTTGTRYGNSQGFPKGGFCEGGEISIIGVARAPVAIINFASNPCENLRVCIGFNKELPHKNAKLIIATGARTHPNY